jgi:hypothetical protein
MPRKYFPILFGFMANFLGLSFIGSIFYFWTDLIFS